MSRSFPAKLLLFGEYTVLSGSQALAVPLHCWRGSWVQYGTNDLPSSLVFFDWLKKENVISADIADRMIDDVKHGWLYQSNIPIGYGVGSSGAYVAALYDRYIREQDDQREAASIMARMESFFHGTSSGMDPLVSLTEHAVVKDDSGKFHQVKDPGLPEGWRMYLLNSGISRHTDSLVKSYKGMLHNNEYRIAIERQLIPMVDHAIHFYLSSTSAMLEQCLSVISQFQHEHFQAMIPASVRKRWDALTQQEGVYVKLCGAGGGGYFLVIHTKVSDENQIVGDDMLLV